MCEHLSGSLCTNGVTTGPLTAYCLLCHHTVSPFLLCFFFFFSPQKSKEPNFPCLCFRDPSVLPALPLPLLVPCHVFWTALPPGRHWRQSSGLPVSLSLLWGFLLWCLRVGSLSSGWIPRRRQRSLPSLVSLSDRTQMSAQAHHFKNRRPDFFLSKI